MASGTSLLDVRTQEDHISGPPGGPKNFSGFGVWFGQGCQNTGHDPKIIVVAR